MKKKPILTILLLLTLILTLASTSVTAVTQDDLLNGLVSYYKLDEVSGTTTVVDSHGSNDGTLQTDVSFNTDGLINGGIRRTSGTSVGNVRFSTLSLSKDFTINTWVNLETINQWNGIFTTNNAGYSAGFSAMYYSDQNLIRFWDSGIGTSTSGDYDAPISLSSNTWYMITVTGDGSNHRVYVNGNLIKTQANTGTPDWGNLFQLGGNDIADYNLIGKIDESLISSRAYTSDEVNALYDIQKDGFESGSYPFAQEPTSTLVNVTNITESEATLNAELISLGNETSANVSFRYRQQGASTWINTPYQELTTIGDYNYTITSLTDNTTYEYKAITTWNNNENETQTSVNNFTTEAKLSDKLLNGLVSYWKLDETSGTTTAVDSHGSNDLTTEISSAWGSGQINNALLGTTARDNWATASSPLIPATDDFSAGGWFYISNNAISASSDNNNGLISQWKSGNSGRFILNYNSAGGTTPNKIVISIGGSDILVSNDIINNEGFYHVIATRTSNTFELFINGDSQGTVINSASIPIDVNTQIGSFGSLTAAGLREGGKADEVFIYNRVLSSDEVSALYDIQKDGFESGSYPFEPTELFTNITPVNGTVFQRQLNATLNFTYVGQDDVNLSTHWYNGTLIQENTSVPYNTTITKFVDNLQPNTEYCWYINYTYDNAEYTRENASCFTPNDEPKLLNFRIENIDANNFTIKWDNEPDMEWASFRIGTDVMEVRYTTGVTNTWEVESLIRNKEYELEFQSADNTLYSMSDYYTFDFRTLGWNPTLKDFNHKRIITINNQTIPEDRDNWAVELTLTEDNFKTCGDNWWDPCYPAFTNLNYTNLNDLRFYDYYDLKPLKYEVTSVNIPGEGGMSTQTIPNEYAPGGDWVDYENAHDGDWSSNAIPNPFGIDYFNYTIPAGAKTTSMFRIYAGEWGYDIQLPSECYGGSKLEFKTEADYDTSTIINYCKDNTLGTWTQVWSTESRLIYETMMTWVYDSEVKVKVQPYKFDDDTQSYVEGVDSDYDAKFLMYYGNQDTTNNETTFTPDGTITSATSVGEEINYEMEAPVITNVIEKNKTTTGINITWEVDQAVDNRIRYATNPYLLETTWASRIINSTDIFLNQKGNTEHTFLLDVIGQDYLGLVSVISSNSSYNNNYTINITGNNTPVEVIIPDLGTTEFLTWEITYTENKTRYRNTHQAEFKLEDLTTNTQYYYEVNAIGQTATTTETGNFTLGTLPTTPQTQFYNYTENRPNKQATICFEITDLDGAASVDYTLQHWNETSTEFEEETTISSVGLGIQCNTIPLNYNENKSYRAKVVGSTTGYSEEYTNLFMPPQEFFAGSYVTDDDDNLERQYCPPGPEGYVDLTQTCYEQTGYREGSHRVEDWIWIETNITTYQQPYTVNWWDGSSWTQHVMNNNTDINYLKLEDLGEEWQTFYIEDNTGELFLNWTKPSRLHPPNKTRKDNSKYVAFNITPTTLNYQEFYMRPLPFKNTTSFQYCIEQPEGNLYDCMMSTYWGTPTMDPELVGTAYDRGSLFRGGIWNGDVYDTGVLNYETPDEREDSYIQTSYNLTNTTEARNCFSFTLSYFNESIYAENDIENYYFRIWQEDQHFSSYLGITQNVTWNYISLFKWQYDPRTYVRDWKAQDDTKIFESDLIRVINETDVYGGYDKSLIVGFKDGFNFDISEYDIYQSGIQTDGQWNNYLTGKHHRSMLIVNLPDNATLQATDSNSDGISDYDALFTYYTDPYTDDTSEDGWTDAYLIANGYDPNNITSHPGPNTTINQPLNNTTVESIEVTFNYTIETPSGIKSSMLRVYNNLGNLIATELIEYPTYPTIVNETYNKTIPVNGNVTWNIETQDQYTVTSTTDTYNLTIDAILGCTDPTADNYNPDAEFDDGSCFYNQTTFKTYDVEGNLISDYYLWINDTRYEVNTTELLYEGAGERNITFQKTNWYNKTFNVNITTAEINLTGVYQALARFEATDLNNDTITNFNVTIDEVTKSSSETWELIQGEYTALFEKTDWYSQNKTINVAAMSNQTYTFEGLYQQLLEIKAKQIIEENVREGEKMFSVIGRNGSLGYKTWSEDGINWATIESIPYALYDVEWSPQLELFAAVGENGHVMWSEDGINWTYSSDMGSTLNTVKWSQELELFVAVGFSGQTIWSENGKNWTTGSNTNTELLFSVAWSPELNLFTAVGKDGVVIWSEDGKNWNTGTNPNTGWLHGVEWSPELRLFVGVGHESVYSVDGKNWEYTSDLGEYTINSVIWSPELQIFSGVGVGGRTAWSENGINWTLPAAVTSNELNDLEWSSELGKFVAIGWNSRYTSSTDGKNWVNEGQIGTGELLEGIAWMNDIHVTEYIDNFTVEIRGEEYPTITGTVLVGSTNTETFNITGLNNKYFNKQYTSKDVSGGIFEAVIDVKPLIESYDVENNILTDYTLWFNQTPQTVNTTQYYADYNLLLDSYNKHNVLYEGNNDGSINLTTFDYTTGFADGDIYFSIATSIEEIDYKYVIRPSKSYAELSQPSETLINCYEVEYDRTADIRLPIHGNYVCARLNEKTYLLNLTDTTKDALDATIFEPTASITFQKTNWYNETITPQIQENENYEITGLHQSKANFEAVDLNNETVDNFNVTINGTTKLNNETWELLPQTYEATFSKTDWYPKTTNFTITQGENTYTFINLYQEILEITARDVKEDTLINNFTVQIRDETHTTTNGTVYVGATDTETFNVTGLDDKYYEVIYLEQNVSGGTFEALINTKSLIKVYNVENNIMSDYQLNFYPTGAEFGTNIIVNVPGNETYVDLLGDYDVTFLKNDWYPKEELKILLVNEDYNISEVHQSRANFEVTDINNDTVEEFNVTINGNTQPGDQTYLLLAGTYEATISKTGYENETINITLGTQQEETYTIEGLYQTIVQITARDVKENALINNYTAKIRGENYTTTNGSIYVESLNTLNMTIITSERDEIYTKEITEADVSSGTYEVQLNTKPLIRVYDIEDNLLSNYTIQLDGSEYESIGNITYINETGTQNLTFTKTDWLNKSEIKDLQINQEYNITEVHQVLVNFNAYDIRGDPISNFNYSWNDSATYEAEGTTSEYHEFLFGTYTFYFNKTNSLPKNKTVTLDEAQVQTITFGSVGYDVTFNLIDEKTLEPFDLTPLEELKLLVYCQDPDRTEEYIIDSNTYNINLTCDYEKIKFQLDYGIIGTQQVSYYRNIILPDGEIYNQTIYLIDANTTFFVYSSFGIDDLLGKYRNPSIWIKRQIEETSAVIQSDFTDIEGKVGLFLIEEYEYIVEIHSENQPTQVIGTYTADQPAFKTINMYDVSLSSENRTGFYQNVLTAAEIVNDTGTPSVQYSYQDPENETQYIQFLLYSDGIDTEPIYESPVYFQSQLELLTAIPEAYENDTLYAEIRFMHNEIGEDTSVRRLNEDYGLRLAIQDHINPEFLNWFLLVLLSVVAIYSSMKTPGVGMAVAGLGLMFVLFGWMQISIGLIVLSILISFIEFMAKQR